MNDETSKATARWPEAETVGVLRSMAEAANPPSAEDMAMRNLERSALMQAVAAIETLVAERDRLREALGWILPLAERYLSSAPSHPDNAKLESARAALEGGGR